jgi:hypothetical protein
MTEVMIGTGTKIGSIDGARIEQGTEAIIEQMIGDMTVDMTEEGIVEGIVDMKDIGNIILLNKAETRRIMLAMIGTKIMEIIAITQKI